MEGFDGGLLQVFHIEVVDGSTPQLLSNQTSPIPFFIITNLKPGHFIRAFIYGSNEKGISKRTVVQAQTIQVAEKRTGMNYI